MTSTTSVVGDSSHSLRVTSAVNGFAAPRSATSIRRGDGQRLSLPLRPRRFDLLAAAHHHRVAAFGAVERVGERQRRLQIVAAEDGVLDAQPLRVLRDGDRRSPAAAHIAGRGGRRRRARHRRGRCDRRRIERPAPEKSAGGCAESGSTGSREARTSKSAIVPRQSSYILGGR